MNYILSFLAGFATCVAIGIYRHRKTNPQASITESLISTMGTAWRPPK